MSRVSIRVHQSSTRRTDSVPTTRHWHWLTGFERIARLTGSEVWPRLHQRVVAFRISQSKSVIECRRLGEVERARRSIVALAGIKKVLHVLGLWQRK